MSTYLKRINKDIKKTKKCRVYKENTLYIIKRLTQ